MANRDLIVIGGSAGATSPLRSILSAFPSDLPAAVLVVLHVPARSTGILTAVARSIAHLPVLQAEDGMRVERGHVYIAGPDRHLLINGDHIKLGRGPRENMTRPAIDPLFRSAALFYGPRTIGVVLSGLLGDGAAGLNAIKRCGGLAVVQEPEDATAAEMPRRAMQATAVDLRLPAAELGSALLSLALGPAGPILPVPPEIRLELDIAAGERIDSERLREFADVAPLSCPGCGGVLSAVRGGKPLRFRCQVGHAYVADALATEQEDRVDEALRVALRIIEERAELVRRMAEDGRQSGRRAVADMYDGRAEEYSRYAETIRRVVIESFEKRPPAEADA